jgi:hypothetical protein
LEARRFTLSVKNNWATLDLHRDLGEDTAMDEFLIPSVAGSGGLLFFDRSPTDRTMSIDGFSVRVTDHNLSATGQVYAYEGYSNPAQFFGSMAHQWTGWPGELAWESLEGELVLRCTHDGLGHISIRIDFRSGSYTDSWRVIATVMTEAGQLERIARQAAAFFGAGQLVVGPL